MRYSAKKGDTLLFTSHLPTRPNLVIDVESEYDDKYVDINGKEYLKRDIFGNYNKIFVMKK